MKQAESNLRVAAGHLEEKVTVNLVRSNRLSTLARHYSTEQVKENVADTNHLAAMAEYLAAGVSRESHSLAVRYRVMPDTFTRFGSLKRVHEAESARWSGLAARYFAEK